MVTTHRTEPVRPAPGAVADHARAPAGAGLLGPSARALRVLGRQRDRTRRSARHPAAPQPRRAAADAVVARRARPRARVRRRRARRRGRHRRRARRARDRAAARRRAGPASSARRGSVASALDLVGPPPAPPPEEAHVHGRRHSIARDAQAISHHYDVGNDFYAIVLGPSMTYSCARWGTHTTDLTAAQAAKHDLVCRKLGLAARPGQRLLDVGCGWGSMAIHAARNYDAEVVGITISQEQHAAARARVEEAGVADRVEIRLQDYRTLGGERFDAISSIGMFEHVGAARMAQYFATLRSLLGPGGRLLNHAISRVGGTRLGRRTFIGRYVFPDGELIDIAAVVDAAERAGFEVRDVESLREHYARTLRGVDRQPRARLGRRRRPPRARAGRASGARTWPAPRSASTRAASRSTRRSRSCPRADGASGIPLATRLVTHAEPDSGSRRARLSRAARAGTRARRARSPRPCPRRGCPSALWAP